MELSVGLPKTMLKVWAFVADDKAIKRDRINSLEYSIQQLDKKIDIDNLSSKIIKQMQSLDKSKKDE